MSWHISEHSGKPLSTQSSLLQIQGSAIVNKFVDATLTLYAASERLRGAIVRLWKRVWAVKREKGEGMVAGEVSVEL